MTDRQLDTDRSPDILAPQVHGWRRLKSFLGALFVALVSFGSSIFRGSGTRVIGNNGAKMGVILDIISTNSARVCF